MQRCVKLTLVPVVYFAKPICLFVLGFCGLLHPFFNSKERYVEKSLIAPWFLKEYDSLLTLETYTIQIKYNNKKSISFRFIQQLCLNNEYEEMTQQQKGFLLLWYNYCHFKIVISKWHFFCHLMWKTFCHFYGANSIKTNLRTCNWQTIWLISYKSIN